MRNWLLCQFEREQGKPIPCRLRPLFEWYADLTFFRATSKAVHSSSKLATMNPSSDDESAPFGTGTDSGGSNMTENEIDEENWYNEEVMGLRLGPHEIAHKLLVETQL